MTPLISIIIPTYREEGYITHTLDSIKKQTLFDNCETVIADYDPQKTHTIYKTILDYGMDGNNINIVNVDMRGIGLARHMGVLASKGYYLVNFDADARFDRNDDIERMIAPLQNDAIAMTHCRNLMNPEEAVNQEGKKAYQAFEIRSAVASMTPMSFEPGLCITRFAYNTVGGFPDIKACEGTLLGIRCAFAFGPDKVKYMPDVTVYVSGRRHTSDAILGFIPDVDYYHAYRGGQVLDVI